ncbi:hypothetical protein MOE90_20855 [Bacillus spizizenii]|nr:hypothetical protein [Bacillus spizizenii]MCY9125039.1 hypothetical protein [Bacillus spizizenii]
MAIKKINVNEKNYKVLNGTYYNQGTPDEVIHLLESARANNQRVRIFLGDIKTGRDWLEEFGTIGTIGRSTGEVKIPLLIKNSRSFGGEALLTDCIVKITIDKKEVYKHKNYYIPDGKIFPVNTPRLKEWGYTHLVSFYDEEKMIHVTHANFKSLEKAQKYLSYIKGETNRK